MAVDDGKAPGAVGLAVVVEAVADSCVEVAPVEVGAGGVHGPGCASAFVDGALVVVAGGAADGPSNEPPVEGAAASRVGKIPVMGPAVAVAASP